MRFLIVDDDFVCRQQMSDILSAHGSCDHAPNGEVALLLFVEARNCQLPYDLITMDIEMPKMTGQEVVKHIREVEKSMKVPSTEAANILMVTSRSEIKNVSLAYFQGCNGYLNKPVTAANVKAALAEMGLTLK